MKNIKNIILKTIFQQEMSCTLRVLLIPLVFWQLLNNSMQLFNENTNNFIKLKTMFIRLIANTSGKLFFISLVTMVFISFFPAFLNCSLKCLKIKMNHCQTQCRPMIFLCCVFMNKNPHKRIFVV